MQVIVPSSNWIILWEQKLWEKDIPSIDDRCELAILNSKTGVESSKLHKGIVLRSKEICTGTQFSIGWSFVIGHIFEEFLAAKEENVSLVYLNRSKPWCKVEWVWQEIADNNFRPFVANDVVFFDIHFFVLRNSEAIDGIIESGRRLVGLYAIHAGYFFPFFVLQRIFETSSGPLAFFNNSSNKVDIFMMID